MHFDSHLEQFAKSFRDSGSKTSISGIIIGGMGEAVHQLYHSTKIQRQSFKKQKKKPRNQETGSWNEKNGWKELFINIYK